MAANATPISPIAGDLQWCSTPLTAANTTRDGTSGTTYVVYTASGGGNGTFVVKLRFQPLGTNPLDTVVRVFLNNGSSAGSAANNSLFAEGTLPRTTATETAALDPVEILLTIPFFNAGYKLFCTLGTAGTAGWQATAFAYQY